MTAPYLSVVIPAYNEEERLRVAVPAIRGYLEARQWTFEILVVNDGSRDQTAGVTEEFVRTDARVRLLNLSPNRGKGGAVRTGMLAASGEFVLFTDADQSTPISEVAKLLQALEQGGYDMAIGSRAVRGAEVAEAQVWYRALAGKLFGLGTRTFAIRGIADTQCGFKCLKRELAQRVFPQVTSNTAIFDIELLIVATREGCRIAELPVKWVHNPDTRIPYDLRRAVGIWVELFRINQAQHVTWPLKVKR